MAEGTPIILHWSPLLHRSFGRRARGGGLIVRVAMQSLAYCSQRAIALPLKRPWYRVPDSLEVLSMGIHSLSRMVRVASLILLLFVSLPFPDQHGFSQDAEKTEVVSKPKLMFGIEVRETKTGVEITDVREGRPISVKISKGDIFRSYELASQEGAKRMLRKPEDLDLLKSELSRGETIVLTILRPIPAQGPGVYTSISILLEAQDLMDESVVVAAMRVEEKTYTANIEYSEEKKEKEQVLVSLFYATDRLLQDGKYVGEPDTTVSDPLKYGVAVVSIPPTHKIGNLERPKFWNVFFGENPAKHIVIRSVAQIGKKAVFDAIEDQFTNMQWEDRKRVLVFVHGYNVSFDDAVYRAAQLQYDLDFPGISMLYSWPSKGSEAGYAADGDSIEWTGPHLKSFFQTLHEQGFDDVFVIAHSMGNRGVTKALIELRQEGNAKNLKELILASPDIDARIFNRDIAPALSKYLPNTTLYASSYDLALGISNSIHAGPRAGQIVNGKPTVLSLANLNVIDTSSIRSDFVGHSDAMANNSVITDISNLLMGRANPPRPRLKEIVDGRNRYWEFIPGQEP